MEQLKEILSREFGIVSPEIKALVGEVNRNFLVSSGPDRYILKESPDHEDVSDFSRDETALLRHLSTTLPGFFQKRLETVRNSG